MVFRCQVNSQEGSETLFQGHSSPMYNKNSLFIVLALTEIRDNAGSEVGRHVGRTQNRRRLYTMHSGALYLTDMLLLCFTRRVLLSTSVIGILKKKSAPLVIRYDETSYSQAVIGIRS